MTLLECHLDSFRSNCKHRVLMRLSSIVYKPNSVSRDTSFLDQINTGAIVGESVTEMVADRFLKELGSNIEEIGSWRDALVWASPFSYMSSFGPEADVNMLNGCGKVWVLKRAAGGDMYGGWIYVRQVGIQQQVGM